MPSNQQRREAAKRKLQRQLVRRQERAVAQRRRLTVVGVVAAVLIIAGGVWLITSRGSSTAGDKSSAGTSGSTSASASDGASSTAPSTPSTPCSYPASGTAAKKASAPTNLSPANSGTVDATVTLNTGTLTFALDRANAPCAVESFLSLAGQNYFNHTPCHRLTTAATLKVLQCGDPSGTGTGGPGYSFADELSGKEKYTAGTVAMANGGPNTNGSQFFIVYGDSQLTPDYTVLGTVTKGLDVVDAIAKKGVKGGGQDGKPAEDVEIEKVTVPPGSADATGHYATGKATATGTGNATGTGTGKATAAGTAAGTASSTNAGPASTAAAPTSSG